MRFDKRAQFFLLAAVIISAVVISFGVTTNKAAFTIEPADFEGISYEVQREASAVADYEIYTGIEEDKLQEFIGLATTNVKDSDPNANLIIITGDIHSGIMVNNHGMNSIKIEDIEIPGTGASVESDICTSNICTGIESTVEDINQEDGVYIPGNTFRPFNIVNVEIGEHVLSFPLFRFNQVIVIIQEDIGDETFIATE